MEIRKEVNQTVNWYFPKNEFQTKVTSSIFTVGFPLLNEKI